MAEYELQVYMGGGPYADGEYSVLAYGAVGDGTTDDSTAIQNCIDAAITAGAKKIVFPPGYDFAVETGLVVDRTGYSWMQPLTIEAYGSTITAPSDLGGAILTIGVLTETQNSVHVRGGGWHYDALAHSDDTAACIHLLNMSYCRLYDVETLYGYYGILVSGSGTHSVTTADNWSAYNSSSNAYMRSCLNGICLDCVGNDNWVNENVFKGGRVSYASDLTDCSTGYALSLTVAGTPTQYMNNNKFVDVTLECAMSSNKPGAVSDEYGAWNSYVRLRCEGFDTPLMTLGTNTKWIFWDSAITDFTDQDIDDLVDSGGRGKVIARMALEQSLPGGQAGIPVLRVFNTTGAGEPAIAVAGTAGTTDVIRLYGNGSAWFTPMAGTPSEEIAGKFFFDNGTKKFKFYNGTAWETITSST